MIDLKEVFHSISLKRKLYFDEMLTRNNLNLMEIEILYFLDQYPENNTFTDIMRSKDYAKSYVSKAITNLVELEYLEKKSASNNKKVYKLFLCEKSKDIIEDYMNCVQKFREDAFVGITEDEYEIFEKVIQKLSDNLTED